MILKHLPNLRVAHEEPLELFAGEVLFGLKHLPVQCNADEVIHEAAKALRFGATTDDFIEACHVYPTMAEALGLVAISFTKDIQRLSCCAS